MPAAAIVLPLVETVVAPIVAPIVSSALAATGVTALSSAAATTIATSALVGGGGGALIAAAQGQDVGQGALMGAIGQAAAPVLGGVVAPQVTKALGETGQTTLSSLAGNTILGATTVADVTTGAIVGAGTSAAKAAAMGGDIGKAALAGAVSGGASPIVSGALTEALGTGAPKAGEIGPQQPTGTQGTLTGGITPLVSGTLGGLAIGQTPERALIGALPGAIGGGLSGAARYGLGLDPSTSQALGQGAGELTRYATASTTSPSYPTFQAPPSPGLSGQGPAPSATLGQSLSIAPTLGYSPGMTVFGSGGEGDRPKQRVWNVASLRNIGEEA